MPGEWMPSEPYLYQGDAPVGGGRPLSQGDVFLDIPLVRAAQLDGTHWKPPVKLGPKALGMLVTHPCSSRSRSTHQLKESLTIAPVVKAPEKFVAPWETHYEYFPLPRLTKDQDYAADLSALCPVRSEFLVEKRIAVLNKDGIAALFHRLGLNSSRLERIPDHYASEAERLAFEMSLWERWVEVRGTEDGFQAWLNGDSSVQPNESRRDVLRWHYEEIREELEAFLSDSGSA